MSFTGIKDPVFEPPFMELMRIREQFGGSSAQWDPWGFVVFKSPEIQDQGQWQACRERFDKILHECTNYYSGYPGLDECLSRLRFQWIEDAGDAEGSIKSIAKYVRLAKGRQSTSPIQPSNHNVTELALPLTCHLALTTACRCTSRRLLLTRS